MVIAGMQYIHRVAKGNFICRVFIIKVRHSKSCKKATTDQNDLKFHLNLCKKGVKLYAINKKKKFLRQTKFFGFNAKFIIIPTSFLKSLIRRILFIITPGLLVSINK